MTGSGDMEADDCRWWLVVINGGCWWLDGGWRWWEVVAGSGSWWQLVTGGW